MDMISKFTGCHVQQTTKVVFSRYHQYYFWIFLEKQLNGGHINTTVEMTSIMESSLDLMHQISSHKEASKPHHLHVCLFLKYFLYYHSSYALMSKEEPTQIFLLNLYQWDKPLIPLVHTPSIHTCRRLQKLFIGRKTHQTTSSLLEVVNS